MAKRGRKRKVSKDEENTTPEPEMKKKADEKVVELDEKDWMPSAALEFFENENFKEIGKRILFFRACKTRKFYSKR